MFLRFFLRSPACSSKPCWKNEIVRGFRRCRSDLPEGLPDVDVEGVYYPTASEVHIQWIYPNSTKLLNRWMAEREELRREKFEELASGNATLDVEVLETARGMIESDSLYTCYDEDEKSAFIRFRNVQNHNNSKVTQHWAECEHNATTGEPILPKWMEDVCWSHRQHKVVLFEEMLAEWDKKLPMHLQHQNHTAWLEDFFAATPGPTLLDVNETRNTSVNGTQNVTTSVSTTDANGTVTTVDTVTQIDVTFTVPEIVGSTLLIPPAITYDDDHNPLNLTHIQNSVLQRLAFDDRVDPRKVSEAFEQELEFRFAQHMAEDANVRNQTVYFYGTPKCLLRQEPCYCDERCKDARQLDCCLQCWEPEQLYGCGDWKAKVMNTLERCDASYRWFDSGYSFEGTAQRSTANRHSYVNFRDVDRLYFDMRTRRFEGLPDADRLAWVNEFQVLRDGKVVTLDLWEKENLTDHVGARIPKPMPCWEETLNRQDLVIKNIDQATDAFAPGCFSRDAAYGGLYNRATYGDYCVYDMATISYPNLEQCPAQFSVREVISRSKAAGDKIVSSKQTDDRGTVTTVSSTYLGIEYALHEDTVVSAAVEEVLLTRWISFGENITNMTNGTNATNATNVTTFSSEVIRFNLSSENWDNVTVLSACFADAPASPATVLIQSPVNCTSLETGHCWKDTPVRGYPKCEKHVDLDEMDPKTNQPKVSWVSPMKENSENIIGEACWRDDNRDVVLENIKSAAEMRHAVGNFSRCSFQVEKGLEHPEHFDLVYTEENLLKYQSDLENRNFYNLSDYICWTNGTTSRTTVYHDWLKGPDGLPVVLSDTYRAFVRFYAPAGSLCEATQQNCYCDELCYWERFQDCCQQCWGRSNLTCDHIETVQKRFQACDNVITHGGMVNSSFDMRYLEDPTAVNVPCWSAWHDVGDAGANAALVDLVGSATRAVHLNRITLDFCSNSTYCAADLLGAYQDLGPCFNNTGRDYYKTCYRVDYWNPQDSVAETERNVELVDRKQKPMITNINYPEAQTDEMSERMLVPIVTTQSGQGVFANETREVSAFGYDPQMYELTLWRPLACTWSCWKDFLVRGYRKCDPATVPITEVCWNDNTTSLTTFEQLTEEHQWTERANSFRECLSEQQQNTHRAWCEWKLLNSTTFNETSYIEHMPIPATMADCFEFKQVERLVHPIYGHFRDISLSDVCYVENRERQKSFFSGPVVCPVSLTPGGNWSEPAAWPDKAVPGDNAVAIIENYMTVSLDVNETAKLDTLIVHGELNFDHPTATSAGLIVKKLVIGPRGKVRIGTSEAEPYEGDFAMIRFWNDDKVIRDVLKNAVAASSTSALATTLTTTTTLYDPGVGLGFYWEDSPAQGTIDCSPTPRKVGFCKAFFAAYSATDKSAECQTLIENFPWQVRRHVQGYFYGERQYVGLFLSECFVYFHSGLPWAAGCPTGLTTDTNTVQSCCPGISVPGAAAGEQFAWEQFSGIGDIELIYPTWMFGIMDDSTEYTTVAPGTYKNTKCMLNWRQYQLSVLTTTTTTTTGLMVWKAEYSNSRQFIVEGTFEAFGQDVKLQESKLTETAAAGSTTIDLEGGYTLRENWPVGSRIAVSSTADYKMMNKTVCPDSMIQDPWRCREGWAKFDEVCYKLNRADAWDSQFPTATQANALCEAEHPRAHLASFVSTTQLAGVTSLLDAEKTLTSTELVAAMRAAGLPDSAILGQEALYLSRLEPTKGQAWVGLYHNSTRLSWRDGLPSLFMAAPGASAPSFTGTSGTCAIMSSTAKRSLGAGVWDAASCGTVNLPRYVCSYHSKCPRGSLLVDGECFSLVQQVPPASVAATVGDEYQAAQMNEYCQMLGAERAQLAKLTTPVQSAFLAGWLATMGIGEAYIGLHYNQGNGSTTPALEWTYRNHDSFTWSPGFIDTGGFLDAVGTSPEKPCTVQTSSGSWGARSCVGSVTGSSFFCGYRPVCGPGYSYVDGRCFIVNVFDSLSSRKKQGPHADMECQKEVSNAGLAKIVTPEQDSVIAQMAETNKDVLIGIRFDEVSTGLQFYDGSSLGTYRGKCYHRTPSMFAVDRCVVIRGDQVSPSSGCWDDYPCETPANYACSYLPYPYDFNILKPAYESDTLSEDLNVINAVTALRTASGALEILGFGWGNPARGGLRTINPGKNVGYVLFHALEDEFTQMCMTGELFLVLHREFMAYTYNDEVYNNFGCAVPGCLGSDTLDVAMVTPMTSLKSTADNVNVPSWQVGCRYHFHGF